VSLLRSSVLLTTLLTLALQAQQPVPEKQVEKRVDSLIKQMTLEEKIGQLNQLFVFPQTVPGMPALKDEDIANGDYGSFLFVSDAAQTNRLQHIAVEKSRLHIPLLFGLDVIHGFKTVFPVPIAMAASFDPATVERAQAVAAQEASAAGVRWTFAPMVDIARDPRWGRIMEGAGEDPFLGAAIARAQVKGFQGAYVGEAGHVLTSVKHFAGYGAADGGRDYDSSYISDEQMWNVYLPPFHAAVEAGAATVMSAYMDLNGVPATGNRFLLQKMCCATTGASKVLW
jgi:beta-glucosidase